MSVGRIEFEKKIKSLERKICNCKEVTVGEGVPSDPGTSDSISYIDSLTGDLYTWDGSAWILIGPTDPSTGLESITEGVNTGWRLVGRNPANFGDIGSEAIDFSVSGGVSAVRGATGNYSMAWGVNTSATAINSTAWGGNTSAINTYATSWGYYTTASEYASTSWGRSTTASGNSATAWGRSTTASGNYSTAWGQITTASALRATSWGHSTTASALNSTAWGLGGIASGVGSTAWGRSTTASGKYTTAGGKSTTASGDYSIALGEGTEANSFVSTVLGSYSTIAAGQNLTAFITTNELFKIGNGSSPYFRSDAFTIYKNAVQKWGGIAGATLEALTPQEGWTAFVNAGTGATINSVGIWSYQGGAWVKL